MRRNQMPAIRKCDGSLEPFDPAKLQRCLSKAAESSGCDRRMAGFLVEAVGVHLRDARDSRPATSDYVFSCLRTALNRTGLQDLADRLVAHRRLRRSRRSRLRVLNSNDTGAPAQAWRKGAIAAGLCKQHGLSRPVARILASEVEQRVFGLGYEVLSTSLIGELVRSELHAWGLAGAAWPCEGLTSAQRGQ